MSWETVRLGQEIRDVAVGFASAQNLAEGTFQIRMNNLTRDNQWDWTQRRRVTATSKQLAAAVRAGDVIFNATNSPDLVGKSGLMPELDEPAVISNHFMRLRPSISLHNAYLAHWLRRQFDLGTFRARAKAWINQATVSRELLLGLFIPLPPLSEQRRLAAILDEADMLRRKRGDSLQKLGEAADAFFAAQADDQWARTTVQQVADLQGGLTVNSRRQQLAHVEYLRVANVLRGRLDLTHVKSLGVTQAEVERTRLELNDVVLVEGHGNLDEVGRAARIPDIGAKVLTHQNHLFRLRPKPRVITGAFLERSLNSGSGREHLRRVANTTSGLNTLNATSVRSTPIRLPPIAVQEALDRDLESIFKLSRRAQRSLEEIDALFASLQHRAFRGEL